MTILNADRWIYSKLTSDSQLFAALGGRVYVDVAPMSAQHPLAVMTFVYGNQVGNVSAERVMDMELWQIATWTDQPNFSSIEAIADRVRTVLHRASGTGVIGATFERQTRMADPEGYKAIILEFRLFTQ